MSDNSTIIEATTVVPESFEKKVLIVDDIELICRVVTAQLKSAGYREVKSEDDPRKVIALIKEFNPDLILLDIFMPHISGLDLLKTIRSMPEFDHIIVLMLSSAGADEQYQSLELGAFGFIQKPITSVNLVQTITSKFAMARRLGVQ